MRMVLPLESEPLFAILLILDTIGNIYAYRTQKTEKSESQCQNWKEQPRSVPEKGKSLLMEITESILMKIK